MNAVNSLKDSNQSFVLNSSNERAPKRLDDPMLSNRAFAIFFIVTILIALTLFLAPKARATSATWNGTTNSIWATSTNWSGNPATVPGTGDTATFNNAGNGNTTLNLGIGVTINTILFNTSSAAAYTIGSGTVGSQTLTLNDGGAITVSSTVTNNETINAAMVLGTTKGAASYTFTNDSTAAGQLLTIAGGISLTTSSSGGSAGTKTLVLGGSGNGLISGNISQTGAALGVSGALTKNGTGTWTISGTNNFTGNTTINAGALQAIDGVGLSATSILQLRGGVFQSSATFTRTVGTAAGNVNWSTSSGGFAANGGVLNIQLNNGTASVTWNGNSFVQTGQTLIFGSSTANNLVNFQNGINLAAAGNNNLNRTIQVDNNVNSTADIARISGVITTASTNNGIVKTGTGVLELTNANTYNGTTAVNAGTLLVNNTTGSGTGTGNVSVTNNGGTLLGGNGIITGAVSVGSGATLAPGATGNGSTAIFRTGALTLSSSSNFSLDLNGNVAGTSYDQLRVTGTVGITGSNLVFNSISNLAIGNTLFILLNDSTDAITGTFAGLSNGSTVTSGGYHFTINYFANGDGTANDISLTVTAVPEPSTWIGGALAFGVLGWSQRRRFVRKLALASIT